jgi:CubicO group peptidase (beta-lactamase class C family)
MTNIRGRSILAVCVLVTSMVVAAVGIPVRAVGDVDIHAVDGLTLALMSKYHVPGVALALIKDGHIVLEKGYGFRDLEARVPVTIGTLFNIGSISKSFTALGIAQLVDQEKVDLDAPVIRYVPDFRLSDPRVTRTVTLRQLLSHASGLPADEEWPRQVPATRPEIIREFATMPITARPGTRFQYCSRCVVLAAYILECVTDQSWETYTRVHIFAPLGMSIASFAPSALEQATDAARPYSYDALGQIRVPWSRLDYLGPLDPAGGIDASVSDMARYALFQLGDGTICGRRVISARMLAELHRPQTRVPAAWTSVPLQDIQYALGWFTAEYRGEHIVFHNGANPGFRASIVLVPAIKAAVVVLTNGDSIAFINAATLRLVEQLLGTVPRQRPAS